jgi:hypothetical protein
MDLERHPIFRQTLIYNFIQLDNFPMPGFMSSPAGWQEMSMIDFNHGDITHQHLISQPGEMIGAKIQDVRKLPDTIQVADPIRGWSVGSDIYVYTVYYIYIKYIW